VSLDGVAILDELLPARRELWQDGEAFGASGEGEILVECDEEERGRIGGRSDQCGRELQRVGSPQHVPHYQRYCECSRGEDVVDL
jgi:hypothetical protein